MSQRSRIVLIVDDSPEDRELYRRYLLRDREYSYTLLEATLGRQGLELWRQHQPDAILLDYRLPDLDGLEFLAQLQPLTQQPCLPVIVIAGQGNEAIAVQAMKAGAQDYIVKERITPERLQTAINGAIETVQLRTQLQQRIERERVVAQITQQIHQSLNLDDILQTTVVAVRQFLHTDRVLVFQLNHDGDGTVVAESLGAEWRSLLPSNIHDPSVTWNQPRPVRYNPAFLKNYIERYYLGQVTAISDIQDTSIDPFHSELLAPFQVKAHLVVPILQDNQFWGLLIAHHCASTRLWQSLEIDLLKELATQMSIALRQAELYQQAQRELKERRQVEAELRQSEEQLRLALSASRMGTWNWNIQTGKISWSDNLEALFGIEPGEFDGSFEMFLARLHLGDRDRVLAAVERAIATGEDYDIEFRVVYPNGKIRWALSQGKVFYDQHGQPIQMAGIDLDITERKQSAEVLRDSEERFRQLAENIDAVFWIKEVAEKRVSYVSPAYEKLWGLNPEELYQGQQAWLDRIHPEDQDLIQRAFQEKAVAGEFDEEYRIILPNGSIRWVRDRCFPLRDNTGEIYRFTGIAEDISERKRSFAALQESEELFRTSVENMLDCFGVYRAIRNEQGQIIDFRTEYVNNAACVNNQMTYEQQIGHGLCELLPGHRGSGLFAEYCQVVETGEALIKDSLVYEDDYGQQRLVRAFDIRVAKFGDGFVVTWRDITARQQTEETLRQSEEFKNRILDSSSDCIKVLSLDGRLLYMNTGGLCLMEIDDLNSYLNTQWLCLWEGSDRQQADQALAAVKTGEVSIFRGYCPTTKGTPKWWEVVVSPILDASGQMERILLISRDITDRKKTELLLQQSEARLKLAYKATRSGLWDWDIIRNSAHVSEEYCHLFGFDPSKEAITYEEWLSCLHPDDRTSANETVNRTIQQQQERYEDDFRILHPDGIRWLAAKGQVFYDTAGNAVRMLGNVQDITDRKQVEEELRQSEERYRCLAELIPQLVWTANPEGTLLDVNQRWLEFTGLTLEQAHTSGWKGVVHPEDVMILGQEWSKAVQQGTSYQAEGRMLRADGVYCWHLHQAIPQKDRQGRIVKWFGSATDIEAQKQLEAERDRLFQLERTARDEAERANRIKDEFLAILSHELRSPLNPILGWTKMLQSRKFNETKTAQALATIERNVKLQTQLIDDLLDIAKILRGKLSLDIAPVNLLFVIESAIDTVNTAAIAKSITLHPILPNIGQVSGDSNRLQQIVWNLLSNAIKFTPKGGRVEIRLERVDEQAQIIVSDTGKGINPDFLPHIFESFRQEDVSITRKYGGLGLGLAIVRQLVEAHGGTIAAESAGEGFGATFTVQLPLLNVKPEIKQINELSQSGLELTGIRVLTVDDDPDARELLTVLLTEYGATVKTVTSAAQVLANLVSFQPDVLVSDIGMPEVDGYNLIQQIRTLPPEKGGQIRAIALTAYASVDDYQRAITSGYQRHVTKPLDPEELVQAVVALAQTK
ncbi:MAG: PAS domain-containing protein [Nostoc sp. DedVER02]|uniref:PAS domain-containing protein n=1 Tax=unclassified Nostoc TaxID=2593658 RepID=UPI002AD3B7D4|nr:MULTISPECIES: PAS domain-containing protein [unclassified Nostoc]MDZ7987413.1 PAS domain-containing protein [Nostoc sp. DedVER02]MDZ8116647.1 PAS domain-containing protein [Nostoc sp. DedVER01b]